MFMDNFLMFRCNLDCWNQLGMKGMSLRNWYEKIRSLRILIPSPLFSFSVQLNGISLDPNILLQNEIIYWHKENLKHPY